MAIVSRPATKEYRDNWPFGEKLEKPEFASVIAVPGMIDIPGGYTPEGKIDKPTVEAICAYLRTKLPLGHGPCALCRVDRHHEIEKMGGDGYPSTACEMVADAIEKKFLK